MTQHHDDYLDKGMRGYIVNIARKNHRRIANYEFDDLVQEGYFCYYKCRSRYVGKEGLVNRSGEPCRFLPEVNPDKVARRHFQSLVCTTFANYLSTLATKHPRGKELPITDLCGVDRTEEQVWDQLTPPEAEVSSVSTLLAAAPSEIKQLFQVLLNDALELAGCRYLVGNGEWFVGAEPERRRRGHRETSNERYCRLLGLPSDYDIVGKVEAYFLGK